MNCLKFIALLSFQITILLFVNSAWAQDGRQLQGEDIYKVTCATGYCHTLNGGAGGGAPRLAARGFSLDYITQTVSFGLHKTKMQGFSSILPEDELQAVIAYVASLNDLDASGNELNTTPRKIKLSDREIAGKNLFHDSLRAFNRCATCHQVEGSGVPVAEPINRVPVNARSLRRLDAQTVSTVTVELETMPALVLSQGAARTIFYDLTSVPPVRRNIESDSIDIKEGSNWQHSSYLSSYTDRDLEKILSYLRKVSD